LSRSILYKLLQRYRQRPQTSSLLPWKRGRKPDEPLLDDECEALLNTCIDEFYLQLERPSFAALHLEVRRRFCGTDFSSLKLSHRATAGGSCGRPHYNRRRHGAKGAREKLGPLNVSSLQPQRDLDVVQIDHTLVDVTIVDRENRQPIARPWLTLAVDIKTRMIAGFHVTVAPPALSICLALTHAVLSKTSWSACLDLGQMRREKISLKEHLDGAEAIYA
jgi:putative transposase